MKYFASQHIHSCFASWSSSDVTLYKKITLLQSQLLIDEHNLIKDDISEDEQCQILHLPSDQTFYNRALDTGIGSSFKHYEDTAEFKNLVKSYKNKGFKGIRPKEIGAYWKRQAARDEAKRKKAGFVLWQDDSDKHQHQGGFSDKLFNKPELHDYVEGGGVFGYIGHSVRKKSLDAYIEKKFMALRPNSKVDKVKLLATWLTSTTGRHFGDSLEGYTLKDQKKRIDEGVKSMFNLAFIYALPEHKGTWESTDKLMKKYASELYRIK